MEYSKSLYKVCAHCGFEDNAVCTRHNPVSLSDGLFRVTPDKLWLGDTVRWPDFGAWNVAIVKQIKDGMVTLFRPYGAHADFSYTGGVICYVGMEEYTIPQSKDGISYILLARSTLR